MRERAALLGGKLRIESTRGSGTQVQAEIPLHPPADDN
jgi:signal transduction histidine kinase